MIVSELHVFLQALNTLRHVIDDDALWIEILIGLNTEFQHQSIDGQQVFDYISEKSGMDLSYFFDQYFRYNKLPKLVVRVSKKADAVKAYYRWEADVKDFIMPIKVTTAPEVYELIYPTNKFQSIDLIGIDPDDFKIAEDQYFVDFKLWKAYIDPRK